MRFNIWILLILVFTACNQEQGQIRKGLTAANATDERAEHADRYMQALTKMGQFNGVLYIADSENVLLNMAYNTTAWQEPTLAVAVNSQFDLRSVAKLFAKATLLKMEEEGKLRLSDPVAHYVKGLPMGAEISLARLKDHTSGFSRELNNIEGHAIDLNREAVIDHIRKENLEFTPGTDTLYSNPGYQLLYYIIGEQEEATFPEVLRKRIFEPAGMEHSGGHFYDSRSVLERYAYGHYLKNDSLMVLKKMDKEDMRMGHLYSTAEDLGKFLDFLSKSEIAESLAEEGVITHAGGSRGKRAWVYTDLHAGYKLVFLSNIDMIPFQELTKDLVRIMEGEQVAIPEPVNRTAVAVRTDLLQTYAGTYDFVDAGHLVLEFRVENDSLVAYQKGTFAGVLKAENDSVFFTDPESKESIIFRKDEQGALKAYMDFQGVQWEGTKIKE